MENEKKSSRTIKERLLAIQEKESQLRAQRQKLQARNRVIQQALDLKMKLRLAEGYLANLARGAAKNPEKMIDAPSRLDSLLKDQPQAIKQSALDMFSDLLARHQPPPKQIKPETAKPGFLGNASP